MDREMTGKEHLNSQLGLNLCNTAVLSVCVMCPKHIEAKLAFNHTSLLPYFNISPIKRVTSEGIIPEK